MSISSPTVALWQLAREMKELRAAHQMSITDVSRILEVRISTVSRWEAAERVPREKELKQLARHYGLGEEEIAALVELRRQAGRRGWWQSYDLDRRYGTFIGLEADAREIEAYSSTVITGLLQTERYAWEIIRGTDGTEESTHEQVKVRRERQERAFSERGPDLWIILGEAPLHQLVGGREVMREQLRHLLDIMDHPKLTLQVIPYSAGAHIGLVMPSFMILKLADYGLTTVYTEGRGSNLFLDGDDDIADHEAVFNKLRLAGMGGDMVRKLLTEVISEI
ncbi:Predicted transcriptional regulator [Marinactinospora thermotolerans DSM 45154]|uniref:Predicted transcriptional regulator n=2 Tax=Marinactinospora thermotolerans TaxID=531310 RepID=A0A1T4SE59_9ACTN|nr:Predicted transcriptional regulator [Marinactinospora thermotolerans DSM 45154]